MEQVERISKDESFLPGLVKELKGTEHFGAVGVG